MHIPQDADAEAALLGAMLVGGPQTVDEVIGIVSGPEAFYTHVDYPEVWRTAVAMYQTGRYERWDALIVRDELARSDYQPARPWMEFLVDLCESHADTANAKFYAERVQEMMLRRKAITAGTQLRELACRMDEPIIETFGLHAQEVDALSRGAGLRKGSIPARELIPKFETDRGVGTCMPTGSNVWDANGGIRSGELTIVAARPSTGKTALGLNIAYRCAIDGINSIVVSAEMTAAAVSARLISIGSGKSRHELDDLRPHELREALERVQSQIGDRVYIYEESKRCPDIVAECRRQIRLHGVQLVVIDYLQLCHMPGKSESRNHEVAAMSDQYKTLATQNDVAVVLMSQLSRAGAERPTMAHLRDSGAIEQDADQVLILHRNETDKQATIRVSADLAKNRNGPTTRWHFDFKRMCQRFVDAPVTMSMEV